MRIHSSVITRQDIHNAARDARADVLQLDDHPSRSRSKAFEITLGGLSKSRTQRFRDERAATYRQWGHFLAILFKIDPAMRAGAYDGVQRFDEITRYAFDPIPYTTDGDDRVAKALRWPRYPPRRTDRSSASERSVTRPSGWRTFRVFSSPLPFSHCAPTRTPSRCALTRMNVFTGPGRPVVACGFCPREIVTATVQPFARASSAMTRAPFGVSSAVAGRAVIVGAGNGMRSATTMTSGHVRR